MQSFYYITPYRWLSFLPNVPHFSNPNLTFQRPQPWVPVQLKSPKYTYLTDSRYSVRSFQLISWLIDWETSVKIVVEIPRGPTSAHLFILIYSREVFKIVGRGTYLSKHLFVLFFPLLGTGGFWDGCRTCLQDENRSSNGGLMGLIPPYCSFELPSWN